MKQVSPPGMKVVFPPLPIPYSPLPTFKAVVTKGKKVGTYAGRIATRATGSFNISTKNGLIQGISQKFCKAIHRKDGYGYAF